MIALTKDNRMLGYELLSNYPNILHFVTTRQGGVGTGNYESMNCTTYTGDDAQSVHRNRELLLAALPVQPRHLVIPRQTHGTEVRIIRSASDLLPDSLYGVDALVTTLTGHCLCISTADCVPVLLYDSKRQVVAAAHAGWRGTVERIVQKTLQAMQSHPADISACIGPSISVEAFEVGAEVHEAFRSKGFDMNKIAQPNAITGKHHINLWEANRLQLLEMGVPETQIECAGICSYTRHETFFSARRLGIHSGRTLSGIMLI